MMKRMNSSIKLPDFIFWICQLYDLGKLISLFAHFPLYSYFIGFVGAGLNEIMDV